MTRPFSIRFAKCSAGFSLVEVTLAIGIVSFALLAVVGLLPVGLKSVKNANEQAGAANVLNVIAGSLRSASSSNRTNFSSRFAGQTVAFEIGGSTTSNSWTNLTLDGSLETAASPKRLSAVANIYPASSLTTPSRAVISVAWSAQSAPGWDSTTQRWTNADGSLTSGIQFLPQP